MANRTKNSFFNPEVNLKKKDFSHFTAMFIAVVFKSKLKDDINSKKETGKQKEGVSQPAEKDNCP